VALFESFKAFTLPVVLFCQRELLFLFACMVRGCGWGHRRSSHVTSRMEGKSSLPHSEVGRGAVCQPYDEPVGTTTTASLVEFPPLLKAGRGGRKRYDPKSCKAVCVVHLAPLANRISPCFQ
jgi:hypothetical protein